MLAAVHPFTTCSFVTINPESIRKPVPFFCVVGQTIKKTDLIDVRWVGATPASSRASPREMDLPNEEAIAMSADSLGIEDLLERAGRADGSALGRLLERHRRRLRRLVAGLGGGGVRLAESPAFEIWSGVAQVKRLQHGPPIPIVPPNPRWAAYSGGVNQSLMRCANLIASPSNPVFRLPTC